MNPAPLPIWTETITVKPFETDFRQNWKPAFIFRALQSAATNHAANLGFDYREMFKTDTSWVLSRLLLRLSCTPQAGDRLVLRTFPKGIQQKIFFLRDFFILGEDGREFGRATSAWLLINTRTRRILSQQALDGSLPENAGLFALDETLDKINPPEDMPVRREVEAAYSSIDLMGHVNNAAYIEWISDCFSHADYQSRRLAWLQINYTSEVKPGERVAVHAASNPKEFNTWQFLGANLSNGTKAFEAALGWENTAV
ncbi:MAG TPA: acyl-ACP thioesterase domain-containing protein [Anaerolineaceae bacterium]